MARVMDVKNGPSKRDLELALFDQNVPGGRTVTFKLQHKHVQEEGRVRLSGFGPISETVEMKILMVRAQEFFPESWTIEGRDRHGRVYTGWFRTDTREGLLERPV